jgi:ABC-type transport system involved in cytochrome c biogenesis permease subunit
MQRNGWTILGFALTAIFATTVAVASETPRIEEYGKGAPYKTLAAFPVMHEGRVKPLDTLAREEVKQIYGRERIWFLNDEGEKIASWEPVAAVLDWSVRPDYWNDQPFIKVEYLPLRRALLSEGFKGELRAIAGKPTTPAADREALAKAAGLPELTEADLRPLALSKTLPKDDAKTIARMHARFGEALKWVTPNELDDAKVWVDGRLITFAEWADGLFQKDAAARRATKRPAVLPAIERNALDLGFVLAHYRELRDIEMRGTRPLLVMPRPFSAAYIKYSGELMEKIIASREEPKSTVEANLSPLAHDTAATLGKYLEKMQISDPPVPGTDPKFDAKYTKFLAENSEWIGLAALVKGNKNKPKVSAVDRPKVRLVSFEPEDHPGSDAAELTRAGFPAAKVEAFRAAYQRLLEAERSAPGRIEEGPVATFNAAARDLGQTINANYYPTPRKMAIELTFNAQAPFWYAPFVYGLAALLLALNLTVKESRSAVVESLRKTFYNGGVAFLVLGILIEVYGFYLRIAITGFAPVTNMYETVIFVGAVGAVIGLVFELIYRKTFTALAAACVATVTTGLAASVPLLDPSIENLTAVLRSNLWLTIHVLTIVSSYAAFAVAMFLGLIATTYYLTTTYRSSASYATLLAPLGIGLPILTLGIVLREASYGVIDIGSWSATYGFLPSCILVTFGAVPSLMAIVAVIGESINRAAHPELGGSTRRVDKHDELFGASPMPTEPSLDGTRELRAAAMRQTAETVKPLANFIYRTMQVGVLLVAAGTILGGVWADYSWGRFWGWDAKEVWALITLLVYLVPLHGRFAGWVNTFGLVMASVVCFLAVLMAWYGVNFVIGVGLHAYGFVNGGSQGSVGIVTLCVLSIAAGTAWRRYLCQNIATV